MPSEQLSRYMHSISLEFEYVGNYKLETKFPNSKANKTNPTYNETKLFF